MKTNNIRAWVHRFGDPRGDRVAHLVERQNKHPMTRGSIPVKSTTCEFFRVKNVVMTRCRCAQPPCICARIRMITYACTLNPVVHVRVRWITETRTECTKTWQNNQPADCGQYMEEEEDPQSAHLRNATTRTLI